MTEAAMLPSDVGAALSLSDFIDACENDVLAPGQGPFPPEKARRLEDLVARAVQMADTLKIAWRVCTQEGGAWEAAPYLRRMQAVEFLARVVVDILTRTQEIVARTSVTHPEWRAPREMTEVLSNLPAVQEVLAKAQDLLARQDRQPPGNEVMAEGPPASTVTDRFQDLASRWKRETRFCSSRTKMVEHPAYQGIIRMGSAALPLILRELRTDPHYWFPALHAITGVDPVPAEDRGMVRKMAEAWLEWGRTHGL